MYNKCIHFRVRSKKNSRYFYCVEKGKIIELNECCQCNCKSFKKSASNRVKIVPNKVYKKKHKREIVSKETYSFVYNRDKGICQICHRKDNTFDSLKNEWIHLELHHINGRGKGKTNNVDNCIMLCDSCHDNLVHKNNKYWRKELNKKILEL